MPAALWRSSATGECVAACALSVGIFARSRHFATDFVGAQTAERLKYAKFKALDIYKAIREGRKPQPGGPSAFVSCVSARACERGSE